MVRWGLCLYEILWGSYKDFKVTYNNDFRDDWKFHEFWPDISLILFPSSVYSIAVIFRWLRRRSRDNGKLWQQWADGATWIAATMLGATCGPLPPHHRLPHWQMAMNSQTINVSVSSTSLICISMVYKPKRGAFDRAKNHKRQRRKRQSATAKREKLQTPKFV